MLRDEEVKEIFNKEIEVKVVNERMKEEEEKKKKNVGEKEIGVKYGSEKKREVDESNRVISSQSSLLRSL